MKAFIISDKTNPEKRVLIFAETPNQAKTKALRDEKMNGVKYIDLSIRRAKYADGHENDPVHELMLLHIQNG